MTNKTLPISTRNSTYQMFDTLKSNRAKRHRHGMFLVEGVRNINEAVNNGWEFESLIYSSDEKLSGWAAEQIKNIETQCNYRLSPELMKELSDKQEVSELLAVVKFKEPTEGSLAEPLLAAVFDRPSNKGNLGTIIRSCDAFGVSALVTTGHGVDIYDPETVSATMGSLFSQNCCHLPSNIELLNWIARLKDTQSGLTLVGTSAHSDILLSEVDLTKPVIFLIGNETDGLSRYLHEASDVMVRIPMADSSSASSFNVACAATVMFYEAVRQRNTLKG